jgi:ankyrin repeat protein
MTEIGNASHLTKESDVKIDFINSLSSSISKWHPLFLAICLGNTKLFDEIQKKTTFDNSKNELTLLNLAIALPNQTEMIKHLLEKKDADPTLRDGLGRNALEMAAIHADNAEIIDLLVKHKQVNIDGCDKSGKTALHFAAASSNVVAARRLIELIQQI